MNTPTVPKNVPKSLPLLDEDFEEDFDGSCEEEETFRRFLTEDFE